MSVEQAYCSSQWLWKQYDSPVVALVGISGVHSMVVPLVYEQFGGICCIVQFCMVMYSVGGTFVEKNVVVETCMSGNMQWGSCW